MKYNSLHFKNKTQHTTRANKAQHTTRANKADHYEIYKQPSNTKHRNLQVMKNDSTTSQTLAGLELTFAVEFPLIGSLRRVIVAKKVDGLQRLTHFGNWSM